MVTLLLRNSVDNAITRAPPSHDAHISASWHTQLQLCSPTVVKRGKCEYDQSDMGIYMPLLYVLYKQVTLLFHCLKPSLKAHTYVYISTCCSPRRSEDGRYAFTLYSSVFCYWWRPVLPVSATSYSSSSIM